MARSELDIRDITHICARIAERAGTDAYAITDTSTAIRVRAASIPAARLAETELSRLGYQADRPRHFGRRDKITIPGWSRARLAARVTALRAELRNLDGTRRETAATAIDRVRQGLTRADDVLSKFERELRQRVEQRAGMFTPAASRALPADPESARLLRTARRLEQQATVRIQRHAHTAELAAHLFTDYRQHITDAIARAAAIHDAYLTGRPGARAHHSAPAHDDGPAVAAHDFPGAACDAALARPAPADRPQQPVVGPRDNRRTTR